MINGKLIVILMTAWFIILSGFMAPHRSEAGDREHFFAGEYFPEPWMERYTFRDSLSIPYPYLSGPHYHGYFYHYPYNEKSPHPYYPRGYRNYYGYYYFHYPREEPSPYKNLKVKPAGELQIMVRPANAKVFVDGYEVEPEGDLSYSIGLLTGNHVVEARAEGYKPYFREVEIERGKVKVLLVELTK